MSGRPILKLRLPPKPAHVIAVMPEAFGCGFDVSVIPPSQSIGHDRELPTHDEAIAYAERLSKATGWPVSDRCG